MLSEYFTPTIDGASNCKIVTHGDSEIYLLCWLLGNILLLYFFWNGIIWIWMDASMEICRWIY